MKTKIFLNSLLAVVIGLCLSVQGALAAAFGISPPWVINENLKPGSNFVYVIDMSTNDPSETMLVKTSVSGDPEVLSWMKIRNADTLTMPIGEQHVPMYIDLSIPKDAKIGKYNGDIMVTVMPQTKPTENVAIYLGGHIQVKLEVVNYDVTDYTVKSVSLEPITEGQNLTMNMQIKNLGNTVLSNVSTKVDVVDYTTGTSVATATANMLSKPIQPQTVGDIEMSYPMAGLEAGKYWVNISAMKNGTSVYKNRLYLGVNKPDINNTLKTTVSVSSKEDMLKSAAATAAATATTTATVTETGTTTTDKLLASSYKPNNVNVKTTVTVRAPLTNKLIGVVIVLLGILIVVTVKFNLHCLIKRRK